MPGTFRVTLAQTPIAFHAVEKAKGVEVPVTAPVWTSSNPSVIDVTGSGADASGSVLALGMVDVTCVDKLPSGREVTDTVTIEVVADEADTLEIQVEIPGA